MRTIASLTTFAEALQCVEDGPPDKGFRDNFGISACLGALCQFIIAIGRDQDSGPLPPICSKSAEQTEAVDVRHVVVDDDAVRQARIVICEQGGRGSVALRIIAFGVQQELQRTANGRIIVGDENLWPLFARTEEAGGHKA